MYNDGSKVSKIVGGSIGRIKKAFECEQTGDMSATFYTTYTEILGSNSE